MMGRIVLAVTPLVLLVGLMAAGLAVEWAVAVLVALAAVKIGVIAWQESRTPPKPRYRPARDLYLAMQRQK